jgi:hypothetical protein
MYLDSDSAKGENLQGWAGNIEFQSLLHVREITSNFCTADRQWLVSHDVQLRATSVRPIPLGYCCATVHANNVAYETSKFVGSTSACGSGGMTDSCSLRSPP